MDHLFALGRYEDIRPIVVSDIVRCHRDVPAGAALPDQPRRGGCGEPAPCPASDADERAPAAVRGPAAGRRPDRGRRGFRSRYLNDDGYLNPVVSASTVVAPGDDTATLVVKVEAGALAPIARQPCENSSPLSDADRAQPRRRCAGASVSATRDRDAADGDRRRPAEPRLLRSADVDRRETDRGRRGR